MITFHDQTRTDASYRLYNSRSTECARLIRPDGSVVHEWRYEQGFSWHYAEMLPNGNLLIYDNGQNVSRAVRGYTRVLEMNPLSGEICWEYKSPGNFYSPSRGSAERLPNGNSLIAHSDSGRLFEVTSEGDIVWEFLNETRNRRGNRDPLYRTKHYPVERLPKVLESTL